DIFVALLGAWIVGKASLVTGALFAVAVSALVVVLYRNGQRSFAAGFAVAYACLSIMSAGSCTFWRKRCLSAPIASCATLWPSAPSAIAKPPTARSPRWS